MRTPKNVLLGRMSNYVRAVAAAMCFVAPSAALANCPCKYKPKSLKHISSASPIPPAHVRCMKFLDEHLDLLSQNLGEDRSFGILKRANIVTYKQITVVDWGVPPQAAAANMVRTGKTNLKEHQAALIKSKKTFERTQDPVALDQMKIHELSIDRENAYIGYSNCVIGNDLPPTAQ